MGTKNLLAEAFWAVLPAQPGLALRAILPTADKTAQDDLIEASGLSLENIPNGSDRFDVFVAIRQLRPKQWIKNALLFLPIVASHTTDPLAWSKAVLAFIVFSLLASAIYVLNDLLDLKADRAHPLKQNRPIASGALSIPHAVRLFLVLLVAAFLGALALGEEFSAIALIYLVLTTIYSFGLKAVKTIDIAMLAGLFSIRVIAGAAATDLPASLWFLAFTAPAFLSLATVKRLTEVTRATHSGPVPGRAYSQSDRAWLLLLATLAAATSVAVFVAYSFSPAAVALYEATSVFRWAALPLSIWLGRMIYSSWKGTQGYDPISHALRDYLGLFMVICSAGLIFAAI
ncbi:MAG: UbiA family prenyltransferase [Pseudomonadota bacterium]